MNSIHDMGGLTCFGPVAPKENELSFHAAWERRVFAMNLATQVYIGPTDKARYSTERMNPVHYLSSSYFERWLAGLELRAKEAGYLSDEEIDTGRAAFRRTPHVPPPTPDMAAALAAHGAPSQRNKGRTQAVFQVGEAVRAKNLEIPGHTRLARYVRGKQGVIARHHGTHVFPDSAALDQGETPQPLYCVRFEARELWGDNVERRDCLYIDLWEDYLQAIAPELAP
jgi:nitrile hydratase beta subunit